MQLAPRMFGSVFLYLSSLYIGPVTEISHTKSIKCVCLLDQQAYVEFGWPVDKQQTLGDIVKHYFVTVQLNEVSQVLGVHSLHDLRFGVIVKNGRGRLGSFNVIVCI